MGCDSVLALTSATVDVNALFGQNCNSRFLPFQPLSLTPPRSYAADEKVNAQFVELPQARQVFAVLGSRPAGTWGYDCGVNERGLAAGCTSLRSALICPGPGLLGRDLVRILLERCHTARQAVHLLASLLERFGHGAFPGCPAAADADHAIVLTDPCEAYAVETAGAHWVYQEVRELRVQSSARIIRQDWDGISRGLADLAIERGWWLADGTKLDFAEAMGERIQDQSDTLPRWGKATLHLQEQNGHIDLPFLRRLLSDHSEPPEPAHGYRLEHPSQESLCRHGYTFPGETTLASLVVSLPRDPRQPVVAWCAFGPPCLSCYFPIFLCGDLPPAFTPDAGLAPGKLWPAILRLMKLTAVDPDRRLQIQEGFTRLQARFDQEAEEFTGEARDLGIRGRQMELRRQATSLMQYNLERFEELVQETLSVEMVWSGEW